MQYTPDMGFRPGIPVEFGGTCNIIQDMRWSSTAELVRAAGRTSLEGQQAMTYPHGSCLQAKRVKMFLVRSEDALASDILSHRVWAIICGILRNALSKGSAPPLPGSSTSGSHEVSRFVRDLHLLFDSAKPPRVGFGV